VNLNKIALLRNSRGYGIPDVITAARTCIDAGAQGITVHPRPDGRHITPADVYELAHVLQEYPEIEFNIEGNPFEGRFMDLVSHAKPTQATLVPDSPAQATSDHGWDMIADTHRLRPITSALKAQDIRVSLFMDPDVNQARHVPETGADRIELYTESYATAFRAGCPESIIERYIHTATVAEDLGLGLNAGHDLNVHNLQFFCQQVSGILEVSIGHELIADAIWQGLAQTVKAYLNVLHIT